MSTIYGPQAATWDDVGVVGERARETYRLDVPDQARAAEAAYEWTARAAHNTAFRECLAARERDRAAQAEMEAGQ